MKKIIMIILTVIFVFSGCTNNKEENIQNGRVSDTENANNNAQASKPKEELISEATTVIYDKTPNRISNIKLAASVINGTQLAPGESFSFNGTTGERNEQQGYKIAPIIMHGEKDEATGGGVCQLSTTIYQAAVKCGLEILERNQHEKPVVYAKDGNDAAVSYGTLDMVFKNNTDFTIIIYTGATDETVTAQIYKI